MIITLTWPTVKHELQMENANDGVILRLIVRKKKTKTYTCFIPDLTAEQIQNAWKGNWHDAWILNLVDAQGLFFGTRVIEVRENGQTGDIIGCVVWTVDHRHDIPHDDLHFEAGVTAEEIEKRCKGE